MKSRSNKAEKKMSEAKTVINYRSLETGCDLCLQRLSYKSSENYLKKTKLKDPKLFLKTDIFNSQNTLKITTKSNGSQLEATEATETNKLQHLRKPIGSVNNETKWRAQKKQTHKEAKTSTILQHDTV